MKGARDEVLWWVSLLFALFAVAAIFLAPNGAVQIGAMLAVIGAVIAHAKQSRPPIPVPELAPTLIADRRLFERFMATDPDVNIRRLLYAAAYARRTEFEISHVNVIIDLANDWTSETWVFNSGKVELLRSALRSQLEIFTIALRRSSINSENRTLLLEHIEGCGFLIHEVREQADAACISYDKFVRECKAQFQCQ